MCKQVWQSGVVASYKKKLCHLEINAEKSAGSEWETRVRFSDNIICESVSVHLLKLAKQEDWISAVKAVLLHHLSLLRLSSACVQQWKQGTPVRYKHQLGIVESQGLSGDEDNFLSLGVKIRGADNASLTIGPVAVSLLTLALNPDWTKAVRQVLLMCMYRRPGNLGRTPFMSRKFAKPIAK